MRAEAKTKSRRQKQGGDESQIPVLDDDDFMAQLAEKISISPEGETSPIEGTCIHAVNGVELVTDAEGVAYWPAEQALLVADLHLEKGSSFARRGQLLPPYDTMTTLKRFGGCLDKWQPKKVIALGDSFHDAQGAERLSAEALELLRSQMMGRDWTWITGNHDPHPPTNLGGTVLDQLKTGGLILRHEPLIGAERGEIAGHLHPKARIVRRGRSIRRSCFAASRSRMILPSFGAYTGGLSVLDPAFEGLFTGKNFYALMRGNGQIYRIAGKDLR